MNRISDGERAAILRFVRACIAAEFSEAETPAVSDDALFRADGACFVTLHEADGTLRGCIGNLEAFEPLGENLRRNALNAAFSDPRFPPLEPEELEELRIEVSVLTPARPIPGPEDFEIGRDGIILRRGERGAVFLPQVAPEQGWDRETTLGYLARKAGLPPDTWRSPDARLFTFQAEVFGEQRA